jgi:hypothetical protein
MDRYTELCCQCTALRLWSSISFTPIFSIHRTATSLYPVQQGCLVQLPSLYMRDGRAAALSLQLSIIS